MKTQALTIENRLTLKRADALAVGDIITGTSKYEKGERAVWHVSDVQTKTDPILGTVVQVNAVVHAPEGSFSWEHHEFLIRPTERLWVQS